MCAGLTGSATKMYKFINRIKLHIQCIVLAVSLIVGSCLDDSKFWSQCLPLHNTPVREMMESHSELRLVIRLNFSSLHQAFTLRWDVDYNGC